MINLKNTLTENQGKLDDLAAPKCAVQTYNTNIEEVLKKQGFSNVKHIGSGWVSDAYNAVLAGKEYIIRVPKAGSDGFNQYKKEHAILEILADKIKTVRIPRNSLYEGNGLAYVVHEKIHGNRFYRNSFEELSQEQQDNFSRSVAAFLSELHSIDINEFSIINGLHWGSLNADFIRESFEKYIVFFRNENWEKDLTFNKSEIDTFCNLIESISNLDEPEVMLHRDFCENNFLVDDNMRLAGVFDFGNASIDSRAIEFNNFVKLNDDGTFQESLLIKKILSYYQQASRVTVTFNDIVNQIKIADAYCITWLVSTNEVLQNNKENLRERVKRIKKWLPHSM